MSFIAFHLKSPFATYFLFFWKEKFEAVYLVLKGSGKPNEPRTESNQEYWEENNLFICICKIPQLPGQAPHKRPPVRVQDLQPLGAILPLCFTVKQPVCILCCGKSDDGFSEVYTCLLGMATRLPTHFT